MGFLADALSVSTQDETLIEAINALVNLYLSGKVQAFLAPPLSLLPYGKTMVVFGLLPLLKCGAV
jgi:hypothetical protein